MKPLVEERSWALVGVASLVLALTLGCGVKGPPVSPEDLLPKTGDAEIEDLDDEEQGDEFY